MISNKIVSILLYVVFGISVLVIAFFYFGETLINEAEFNAKKAKIEMPDEPYRGTQDMVQADTTETDSLVSDTAAVIPAPVKPEKPAKTVKVKFTFFEKLIYFKTDISLGWAYILVGITLLLALIFPVIYMFSNKANMIRTLGILAIAAVMIFLAYSFASDTPLYIPGFEGTDNRDPGVLKFVDTAMFTTYFLIGLALLSILYSEVAKYFK